jgi:hypothetical protein
VPNRLTSRSGKFSAKWNDFSGGLSAIDYQPNTYLSGKNLIPNDDGSLEKRGPMPTTTVNIAHGASTEKHIVHNGDGTSVGPTAYFIGNPIYAGDTNNNSANTGPAVAAPSTVRYRQIDDKLFVGYGSASAALQFGGTAHTVLAGATQGNVTRTVGSKQLTFASALSTTYLGSFIEFTADSGSTASAYQIKEIAANGLTAKIDRAYNGSAGTLTNTAYTISSVASYYTTQSIFTSDAGLTTNRLAANLFEEFSNRMFVADTTDYESTPSGHALRHKNRLRWSGLAGSSEGTAPHTGIYGFNANAYLDLKHAINELSAYGSGLLVFTTKGIYALFGSPTFDSTGSLDASTFWSDIIVSVKHANRTPFGVAFADQQGKAYLWDGAGYPTDISKGRVTIPQTVESIGYYKDFIVFACDSGSQGLYYCYEPRRDRWFYCETVAGSGSVGRVHDFLNTSATTAYAVYRSTAASGTSVFMDAENMFSRGSTGSAKDENAASNYDTSLTTTHLGDSDLVLRARRLGASYRFKDQAGSDPTLTVQVKTGLSGAENSLSSVSLAETTQLETRHSLLSGVRDPMVQVVVTDTGSTTSTVGEGALKITSLSVDGSVVRRGDSS